MHACFAAHVGCNDIVIGPFWNLTNTVVGGLAGNLMHEQGRNFAGPKVMTSVPYWDLNGY
ncbi:unnamed protein product [Prunus armeniaca]